MRVGTGTDPVAGSARDIKIDHLTFAFRAPGTEESLPVLNDCCYQVTPGSFVCIIGASGCGKSTLLAIIAGYLTASSGRVLIGGEQAKEPDSKRIMVFQQSALFPWYTAAENIAFGLRLKAHRTESARRDQLVQDLLDLVGLGGAGNRYPHELSGGMRQRIEIARALAVDPGILLMDEPLGALDSLTRLSMQQEILSIWERTRKTILFVTHDIGEAVILADEIVVMTGKPANMREVVRVELPRPRSRENPEVVALAHRVAGLLHASF